MKIKITKYKTIENLELSIPAKISGGNGLGKSTILEAISFVFTGKNLDGKEFEQVYDNRVDIHDAIADVSFFDNYGNEWQCVVKPIFQTNRAGIEEIKIKRSTECRKNSIPCNDFSDEFQDFYKFGTDYFFNQKEDLQRSIFIDNLKSLLPVFDVNAASLKLKELKKSQKIEVEAVKSLNDANKSTKDVAVPKIPTELEAKNNEFLSLQSSSNADVTAEINKRNNEAMNGHFERKKILQTSIFDHESIIAKTKSQIDASELSLNNAKNDTFTPKEEIDRKPYDLRVKECSEALEPLEFFETIEKYAEKYFSKNPVCVENASKIAEIQKREFVSSSEISGCCPLSGEICETARLKAVQSEEIIFKSKNDEEIRNLKARNRTILDAEMQTINSQYRTAKIALSEAESVLNNILIGNAATEGSNKILRDVFEAEKKKAIAEHTTKIEALSIELKAFETDLAGYRESLTGLQEPAPEKMPESLEISQEIKEAHSEFEALKVEINKAQGVNENNAKLIVSRNAEIKAKQALLLEIGEQIATFTAEISDYFNNLKGIVAEEFKGEIEIGVELLEYVMSRDEYKDCFKITANGKVFPYECNGALQNNVKIQILANLQRLKGYSGITVMDNCEANTTQEINTLGLNCVLAYATLEKELTIK